MAWSKEIGKVSKQNADYAKSQGDYAKQQADNVKAKGDYAQQVADENKTRFLPAVETVALRNSTYPNPQHGDTVRVTSEAATYRYVSPTGWVLTDRYNATAIDEVTQQLADMVQVNVKDYGAKGDGITNDTKAFQDAAAALNASDGGKLIIPKGVYIVGKQTFAGATGKGYSYTGENILRIDGCDNPVIIDGGGSILKADPTLKFGSFNPITGEIHNPTMPFLNGDYRADAYPAMIGIFNCKQVVIRDIELDGNLENIIIGGEWGDQGRQCKAYGLTTKNIDNLVIEGVKSHHHALDGMLIAYDGLTDNSESKPTTLINVECQYNARQGLTWDSGNNLTVINSKFNYQGKSRIATSPSAGVDIETGGANICRNGLFIGCEFNHNVTHGLISDSGDSKDVKFSKCTFWGTSGFAIYPNKPNFIFEDCKIFGTINGIYNATNYQDATKFIRCHIEDKMHDVYGAVTSGSYLITCSAYATFKDCNIIANYKKSLYVSGTGQIFEDTRITHNFSISDGAFQALLSNARLKNVRFSENLTDGFKYYISVGTPIVENVSVDGPNVLWGAVSPNGASGKIMGGRTDYTNHNDLIDFTFRAIGLADYKQSRSALAAKLLFCAGAAPTTGTWDQGDRVFNSKPAVGQPKSWVCTVSGTPGTWVSEGNL